MSLDSLQERLTALQETTSQLKELIDRLAHLKFPPGSVPLRTDEKNSESAELGSEINQLLREEEDELEILQEEVEDLRSGRPGSETEHHKTRLRDGIERLGKELASHRVAFCKAQLAAHRNLAQAQRLERKVLANSNSEPTPPPSSLDAEAPTENGAAMTTTTRRPERPALSDKDQAEVAASSAVTRSMARLRGNIEQALAQSHAAYETLDESSAALNQVGESYTSLDSMLATSRELLGSLMRSQKSDTWYLQTTFYMLLCVISWLVFRRLLYGPLWLLVWLPLKLVFRTTAGVGSLVVGRGGVQSSPGDPAPASEQSPASVEGIPDDSLPIVGVGQHKQTGKTEADPDSMVEKVGKIIDGENDAPAEPKVDAEGSASKPVEEKDEL